MSREEIGQISGGSIPGLQVQPDSTIVTKNDDTMDGTLVYKLDADYVGSLPKIGDAHPDDDRLECINVSRTYDNLGIVTATCSYFGLSPQSGQITVQVTSYQGGTNSDPIQTHPGFDALTASSNYSYDAEGNFLGFTGGDLQGVTNYLTPSSTVTLTAWRSTKPNLNKRISIYPQLPYNAGSGGIIPSFSKDIVNWLLIDSPYRKVGSFYQVSDTFLASGPDGWSTDIY